MKNRLTAYLGAHWVQFLLLALVAFAWAIGVLDHAHAAGLAIIGDVVPSDVKTLHELMEKAFKTMQENIAKVQDTAMKALEETRTEGTLHAKTNEKLTELGKTGSDLATGFKELKDRVQEIEQKGAHKPSGEDQRPKSIGQLVVESEQYKDAQKHKMNKKMNAVEVGSFHRKTAILSSSNQTTLTQSDLVTPDYRPGIIMPGLQRLTIRDLLPQNRTSSNLIVFAKENVFTNNAGPQYNASPGDTDGALKNESALTFTMANTPVITLAHWIPASEQILDDAQMLAGYVDGRLRYGLALEEEKELLLGDGTSGKLTGLNSSATAFNGGATNQTALDTILKAYLQISLSFFEPSGVILHPTDWTNMLLLKDTLGRYLFSDPQGTTAPRLWGKNVVPTPSQTQGKFTAGAFSLAAEIYDREDANVSVSNSHADFFVRNMVAILCEERLALAVYRAASIVYGDLSYAG